MNTKELTDVLKNSWLNKISNMPCDQLLKRLNDEYKAKSYNQLRNIKPVPPSKPPPPNKFNPNLLFCDKFDAVNNLLIYGTFPNQCGIKGCTQLINTVDHWQRHIKSVHPTFQTDIYSHYKQKRILFEPYYKKVYGICTYCSDAFSTVDPYNICDGCNKMTLFHATRCCVSISILKCLCWDCYQRIITDIKYFKTNQPFEIISYSYGWIFIQYAIQQSGKYYFWRTTDLLSIPKWLYEPHQYLMLRLLSFKSFMASKIYITNTNYQILVYKNLFNRGIFTTQLKLSDEKVMKPVAQFIKQILFYRFIKQNSGTKLEIANGAYAHYQAKCLATVNHVLKKKIEPGVNNNLVFGKDESGAINIKMWTFQKNKRVNKDGRYIKKYTPFIKEKTDVRTRINATKVQQLFKETPDSVWVVVSQTKMSLMINYALKRDLALAWSKSIINAPPPAFDNIPFAVKPVSLTDKLFTKITKIPIRKIDKAVYSRLSAMGIIVPLNLLLSKEIMLVTGARFQAHKDYECGGHGKPGTGYENFVVILNLYVGGHKRFTVTSDKQGHALRVLQPIEIQCVTGTMVVMLGDMLDVYWHSVEFDGGLTDGYYLTIQYRIPTNKSILKYKILNSNVLCKRKRIETDMNNNETVDGKKKVKKKQKIE